MQVYRLSAWRNSHLPPDCLGPSGEVIPQNIIDKAPSAELRENQTDQDSLPPYPVLDDILECLVENEMSVDAIVANIDFASDEPLRVGHMSFHRRIKPTKPIQVLLCEFTPEARWIISGMLPHVLVLFFTANVGICSKSGGWRKGASFLQRTLNILTTCFGHSCLNSCAMIHFQ